MNKLLIKEIKLGSSKLTWFFIAFGFMTLIPGYPILCGAFFVCFGIFQSFQYAREANDMVFTALLPVAKKDVVKAKYSFAVMTEMLGFILMVALTLLRMTLLSDAAVYRNNALMNANPFFLCGAFVIFGLFNLVFIGGFFRTAYRFTRPFVMFIICAFLTVGAFEALHHFLGFEAVNAFGFDHAVLQTGFLIAGALIYAAMTLTGIRVSQRRFEKIDL